MSKTGGSLPNRGGGSLKTVFDPVKAEAAEAVLQPSGGSGSGARNRKAGGRSVRISGYLPEALEAALRDEVIKRTVADRRPVSFNDVLCSILTEWHRTRQADA